MNTSTPTVQVNIKNEIEKITTAIESIRQWENGVNLDNQYDCSICCKTYDNGQVMALECGHIFHRNCLTQWFKLGTTCPKCKQITSMDEALSIYLDNKTQGNSRCLSTDGPAPAVLVDEMKKTFGSTRRTLKNLLARSTFYIVIFELILYLGGAICSSIIDTYLKTAIDLEHENVIQSRYSKVLELYMKRNLSDVKYDLNKNTLRDQYLNEKGYTSYWKSTHGIASGCVYGILFGLLVGLVYILYEKITDMPFFGKTVCHTESNKVEEFASLIKKLERIRQPFHMVPKYLSALGVIYLIVIGFNGPFNLMYKKQMLADYVSLFDNNFKLQELIIENKHHIADIKGIEDLRMEYFKEMNSNEGDIIYLNKFGFLFNAIVLGMLFSIFLCLLVIIAIKCIVLTKKINRIIEHPAASNEIHTSSV